VFVILVSFIALVITLFVVARYLIKDILFDAIIYHHHIILFYYLLFVVVHHIISLA
jgi:hypothetical protein